MLCKLLVHNCAYLSHRTQAPLELELVDTLVGGFAHLVTFVNLPLSPTTSNSHTVHHITLLCLVAKTTGFIRSGWARCSVDGLQLAELPAPHTKEEAKQVRLLLAPELFEILIRTHHLPSHENNIIIISQKLWHTGTILGHHRTFLVGLIFAMKFSTSLSCTQRDYHC